MQTTYLNLLPLAEARELTDEECAQLYKQEENPIYLATMFTRHFAMLTQVSNKYWGVTEEDRASFCLEEVHRALLNFLPNKNARFFTFLHSCLCNRFRAETQALNADKRKTLAHATSFYADKETTVKQGDVQKDGDAEYETVIVDKTKHTEKLELLLCVEESNLSEKEKAFCRYALENNVYATDTDFAKQQSISSAAVFYIKQSLKEKIGFVLA
jgi:hypothetical protein